MDAELAPVNPDEMAQLLGLLRESTRRRPSHFPHALRTRRDGSPALLASGRLSARPAAPPRGIHPRHRRLPWPSASQGARGSTRVPHTFFTAVPQVMNSVATLTELTPAQRLELV